MYKIVLADDEPIIIRGLKKMMDWERLRAEIVGEAQDGKELLQVIEKLKPDIVISDIAMPQATGLDVIKKIRKNEWDTKVIFLSGFQEFAYAREAITYGAVDYLLKPVGQEELEEAILKAELQLQKDRPLELWEEDNGLQSVFEDVNSNHAYAEFYEHFQEMGINIAGKFCVGICLALSNETMQSLEDRNKYELLRFNIFKRIQEYSKKEKIGFVIKRDDNSSNMMFVLPKQHTRELLESELKTISDMIQKECKVELMIGVGEMIEDIAKVQYAYKTAKFALELHYFWQKPIIWYEEIEREFQESFDDYSEAYKEFIKSVINKDEWRKKFEKCLNVIENLHYGNRFAAENRCIVLAMDFYRDLKEYKFVDGSKQAEYESWIENLKKQNTYIALKKIFTKYLSDMIEEIFVQQGNSEHSTIHQVKEYIEKHYAEDLSLGQMAKMVYMNPYYFSTFFKKETGQNFKTYVTQVKMKKALRILLESDMKTYELAESVGYKDVRTFTDKFKDAYGESPSNYKKSRCKSNI